MGFECGQFICLPRLKKRRVTWNFVCAHRVVYVLSDEGILV